MMLDKGGQNQRLDHNSPRPPAPKGSGGEMSDDLITRLTWVAADDVPNCGAIRHEAAAEIRRLRDQLAIAERALKVFSEESNWHFEQFTDLQWHYDGGGIPHQIATAALAAMRQRKEVE